MRKCNIKLHFFTSDSAFQLTRLHESKCAYHLSELTGPKQLVLIGVNGKVKVDPCNYSRDPCVKFLQEMK